MAYNGASSAGSNLGPSNPALTEAVQKRIAALRSADPENQLPIPVDLVTASGSGLDPHISPAAALYQVSRVSKARGIDEGKVAELVRTHIQDRQFGIFGEPTVNVLRLNVALDCRITVKKARELSRMIPLRPAGPLRRHGRMYDNYGLDSS